MSHGISMSRRIYDTITNTSNSGRVCEDSLMTRRRTVRVTTSGLYGFPPKPYKLFKFFFTISVIFLKMGKVLISSFQVVDA